MTPTKFCCIALAAVAVSACNDKGGLTYDFVAPRTGSQSIFAQTIIDNSNNTINETVRETTTADNVDGSYAYTQDDPNNDSVTLNGTTYSVPTENLTANASGQVTSYSYTPAGGSQVTCTVAPHGAGPNYPIAIGALWSIGYTETCGTAAPIAYSQSGSVVDLESITIPAGTFNAIKLQSTLTWTTNGTVHTKSITTWREASDGSILKMAETITYSGTAPVNGYPVSITKVLQSRT
ncbi:MAG: hypothetical protein P4L83_23000 [Nevskia sp.]|nr:hypothetical protein [Nevskia sp.]